MILRKRRKPASIKLTLWKKVLFSVIAFLLFFLLVEGYSRFKTYLDTGGVGEVDHLRVRD